MRPINGSWKSKPGNFDVLRALEVFPSSDPWGIPTIPRPRVSAWPDWMVCCDDWPRWSKAGKLPKEGIGAIHFFTDDYRFEAGWNNPARQLARWHDAQFLCSPDFSLYRDHPLAIQLWNTYRNRWMGRRFVEAGRVCIPTIGWSDEASYEFCFRGVEVRSAVIVSTVGTQAEPEAKRLFMAGYEEMCRRIRPEVVFVHGERVPDEVMDLAPVRRVPAYQVMMRENMAPAPKSYMVDGEEG